MLSSRIKMEWNLFLGAQRERLEKDITLLRRFPEIVDTAPPEVPLSDWQQEVATARRMLLHELKRLTSELGSVYAAAARLEKLANKGQLPADLQALVIMANPRQPNKRVKGISARTLTRWYGLSQTGAMPVPKEKRIKPLPLWAKPLVRLLVEDRDITLYDAVREVKKRGISCNPKTAVRFVNEMAGRIRAEGFDCE